VVLDFCKVMVNRDAEALRPFPRRDAVYQNVGKPPFVGIPAIEKNLRTQFSAFPDSYEYRVVNVAGHDNIVLTERLDMIRTSAGELRVFR
jgi:limonene-1,2-epoxide hydrolase